MKSPLSQVLTVNEIFYSIQGEGPFAGCPCIFIRTTGCQMRCHYCDTEYAFYEGAKKRLAEIMHDIQSYHCNLVQITGGEPLLQFERTLKLIHLLQEQNYKVLLETGGGFSLEGIPDSCVKIVDVKCPDSGELENMNWSFLHKTYPNTFLKFVLSSENDYLFARDWLRRNRDRIETYGIYFSPVENRYPLQRLAHDILTDQLDVKLQIQLHKKIWGNQRGV